MCLDGTTTTEKEFDTVEVLKAIQKAKEAKGRMANNEKKVFSRFGFDAKMNTDFTLIFTFQTWLKLLFRFVRVNQTSERKMLKTFKTYSKPTLDGTFLYNI